MAKRMAYLAVTVALISFFLTLSVTTALAQPACQASLKGMYALVESGTIAGVGPYAAVGIVTAGASGEFSGTSSSSYNGFIVEETFSGTYSVSPDCNGTASFTGNVVHGTANRALVILGHGREIQFIATDPGQVITGTLKRLTGL